MPPERSMAPEGVIIVDTGQARRGFRPRAQDYTPQSLLKKTLSHEHYPSNYPPWESKDSIEGRRKNNRTK
jgi:hypothetical protein